VLGCYALSRLVVAAGLWATVAVRHRSLGFALRRWDARWYVWVAAHGYPRSIHRVVYDYQSPHSFFPLFPLLIRMLRPVGGGSLLASALVLNLVLGAAFALAGRAVFAEVVPPDDATRGAILLTLFPGSFVLSLAYSEALALTLAALALLALFRRRLLVAGVAGALATATRPNMVVLVAAGTVAAVMQYRQGLRPWKALLAPLLTLAGVGLYVVYLRIHTGYWDAWQRAETGFGQRRDLLTGFFRRLPHQLQLAFTGDHANYTVYLASLVALVVLLLLALRPPIHPLLMAYCLGLAALSVSYSAVNARPRFLLAAFPLVLGYSRRLGPRATVVVGVLSAVGLAATTYMYLGSRHVVP